MVGAAKLNAVEVVSLNPDESQLPWPSETDMPAKDDSLESMPSPLASSQTFPDILTGIGVIVIVGVFVIVGLGVSVVGSVSVIVSISVVGGAGSVLGSLVLVGGESVGGKLFVLKI